MKIEELTPLKELAFNYVKNTLKKDIKLEDIYSIVSYVYGVRIQFNFYVEKQDIFIKFEDLGIEYDKRDEYAREVYASSINHVVRLLTGEEHACCNIPNISTLLRLESIGSDSTERFLHQQIESFTKTVTGDSNAVDCYWVANDGIRVRTDIDEETLDSEEYFFPNELLAMSGYEAKELYVDTLAKLEEDKKQRYIKNLKNEIRLQEKSLAENKKRLEELEKNKQQQ